MGSRSTNLRTKVVALLVSLVALWGFTAWVTVRDGVNLLGVQALDTKVFDPTEPLLLQLQLERRTSVAYLGRPDDAQRATLAQMRQRTDELAAAFTKSTQNWQVGALGSDTLDQRITTLTTGLNELSRTRTAVDDRSIDRAGAAATFTAVIESIYRVYDALGNLDDEQVAEDTAALIGLNRSRELLSQEDALLAGVLAAGRITPAERAEFTRFVGARQFVAASALVRLPAADQHRYEAMSTGATFGRLTTLETQLMQGSGAGRPPVTATEWNDTTAPALTEITAVVLAGGDDVVDRATPVAIGVVVRLALATGLGLLAVIASIIVSITTARALVRQLERLRDAAFRLANERLPSVVERLGRGEEVDVATEAPPLDFGNDEVGQVGKAFNAVQETALRTAVEQAELRRNVREVFLSLARRTQALVHRQLTLLDAMERREHDAEELEDLFRVDHLATRMRRNAENLIVLSGSTPGRAWRRNVPMVDVVRGAVAEVEDYTRVNVLPLGPVSLAGRAVGDVIHLLAELIENGLSFSPPHTTVEVRGQLVANGFAIEIEDRGLGMSEEDLAAANDRIVDQSELNLANAARLGLYVVSRLTERHGVRVRLKESAYGGTTAVVLIPAELITEGTADPENSGAIPTGSPAIPLPAGPSDRARPAPLALAARPTAPGTADSDASQVATEAPGSASIVTETEQADGTEADGALPTRQRTTPATGTPELPTRVRRTLGQPALEGPTLPTGLPAVNGTRPTAGTDTTESNVDGDDGPAPERVEADRTNAGLPVRVRQASIVPELRDEPATESDHDDVVRQPEQVRKMMSSYQTGTRRGRTDAARLLGGASDAQPAAAPEPAEDPEVT
ncbi:nitrate- and nitrite sensing domain-containing protein [Micromonospora sp. LAH09]|uniref:sensor histidine kinase n=1 Tax=Micromonospora cabrerizensis TaxID=2911213 RepID=UPI001EE877E5|nr:nitrate- and nitrite sensing domain-containing protein [Micromonospora cabrerizensis]MCG5473152.1 nitrate- and nitrite sensing domain-containing protein [Micromonospora cabrerizensis]